MTLPVIIPYDRPFFTAEQVSKIDNLNRNTLLGYVKRYNEGRHYGRLSSIGLSPITPGTAREFSIEQTGLLAVLRMAMAASAPDALLEAMGEIADHSRALFASMTSGLRWETWGADPNNRRPYLPIDDKRAHLEARSYFGREASFHITDRPYSDGGESLLDLAHFPLPVMLLPLDATLRNAWTRALWVANGVVWHD